MNIDERLQYLLTSTESLHSSMQEAHAAIAKQTAQIAAHTKQLETDGEHIRALARIAEIHERRLQDLEQPPSADPAT